MTGRPSKLTPKLLKALGDVLYEYALICTDEELWGLLNEKLPKKERIGYSTFQKYKLGETKGLETVDTELIDGFVGLIKKALVKERKSLFQKLETDPQWQRYAWILERKFDAWNLRSKNEHNHKNLPPIPPTLQIEVVNASN